MHVKKIFDNAGSDKACVHRYDHIYSFIGPYVDSVDANYIMEIGYETGAGTYAFGKLFNRFNFVSLDIDYSKDKYPKLMKPKFDKIVCDCSNEDSIKATASYLGDIKFSLIVDDASHRVNDQRLCLEQFWTLLAPGGIYLIEDIGSLEDAYKFQQWPGFFVADTRPIGKSNDICVVLRKECKIND